MLLFPILAFGIVLGKCHFAIDLSSKLTCRELPGMPAASLGILGATTLTAYQGIFEVLKPKAGDTLVVSGAAG